MEDEPQIDQPTPESEKDQGIQRLQAEVEQLRTSMITLLSGLEKFTDMLSKTEEMQPYYNRTAVNELKHTAVTIGEQLSQKTMPTATTAETVQS
jgi:hypothetical protein